MNNIIKQKTNRSNLIFLTGILLVIFMVGCSDGGVFNETVTDVDGNQYKTVKIGDQIWMAENLKVTKYKNGDKLNTAPKPFLEDNPWYWEIWSQKDACLNYLNDENQRFNTFEDGPESRGKYGLLYNAKAVNDSRCLCPEGYHMPTKEEFETLIKNLGGYEGTTPTFWAGDVAPKLISNNDWDGTSNHYLGNNESGFNALPSGWKSGGSGPFGGIGEATAFWTSTLSGEDNWGENFHLFITNHHITDVKVTNEGTGHGYSVRCIKDYSGMVINQPKTDNTHTEQAVLGSESVTTKQDTTVIEDTTVEEEKKIYYNGCGYSYESKEDCMTQCGAFGKPCTEGEATGTIVISKEK
jgi:uncharacterized protein (TIGR02145 family)